MAIKDSGQIGFNDLIDEFGSSKRIDNSKDAGERGSWSGEAIPLSDYYRGRLTPDIPRNNNIPYQAYFSLSKLKFRENEISLGQFYGAALIGDINVQMPYLRYLNIFESAITSVSAGAWYEKRLDASPEIVKQVDVTPYVYDISIPSFRVIISGSFRDAGKSGTDGRTSIRNPGIIILRKERRIGGFLGGDRYSVIGSTRGTGESNNGNAVGVDVPAFKGQFINYQARYNPENADTLRFVYIVDIYENGGEGTPKAVFLVDGDAPKITISVAKINKSYEEIYRTQTESTGIRK
jgi:hypothetical protein